MTLEATASETKYLESARSLAPLIEQEMSGTPSPTSLSPLVVEAFHDAGLYWMQVPACFGGGEADVVSAFEVVEEVSRADGSSGWSLMAGMSTLAIAGAFFGDGAAAEIFADPRAVTCGQIAPLGTVERTPEGFLAQGRFGFASGSTQSMWFFGGFREQRDGVEIRMENGLPSVIAGVVPKDKVVLRGNWDVVGLEGTCSVDYEIPEQLIPDEYTFPFFSAVPRRGGPMYNIAANGLTCIAHAGFACGVARRALDEIGRIARTKRRPGRRTMIDDPIFQYEYAMAEAGLRGARSFAVRALRDLQAAAEADHLTLQVRGIARLAASHACAVAAHVVGLAYEYSGSNGLRNGSAIQRCFRNISAGQQHVFTDRNSVRDAGQVLLDAAPPTMFL